MQVSSNQNYFISVAKWSIYCRIRNDIIVYVNFSLNNTMYNGVSWQNTSWASVTIVVKGTVMQIALELLQVQ